MWRGAAGPSTNPGIILVCLGDSGLSFASPTMLTLYLASFVIGGVLVLVSAVAGGHGHGADAGHDIGHDVDHDVGHDTDHDVGHDADHDVDHDVDHCIGHDVAHGLSSDLNHEVGHASAGAEFNGPWLPFLSLRFWTFFAAFFGVTGLIFDGLWHVPSLFTLAAALGVGAVSGTGVSWLMRFVRANQVDSSLSSGEIEGASARVLLPVSRESEGKVRVWLKGYVKDLRATTDDDLPLNLGAQVLVVRVVNSVAKVTALPRTAELSSECNGER